MTREKKLPRTAVDSADGVRVGEEPVPGMRLRCICRGHTDTIGRIAWSACGRFIASPSSDKTIRIWDANDGKCLAVFDSQSDGEGCAAWAPKGMVLATASNDGSIHIWKVIAPDRGFSATLQFRTKATQPIVSLAWHPEGNILAAARGNDVGLYDVSSKEWITSLCGHSRWVSDVSFSDDGQIIASTAWDRTLRFWDIKTKSERCSLQLGHTYTNSNCWLRQQSVLVAAANREIEVYDVQSRSRTRSIEGNTEQIIAISLSADGLLLAGKAFLSYVSIWNTRSWQRIATIHESGVPSEFPSLAFHPTDSSLLATLGDNHRVIRVWELNLEPDSAAESVVRYTSAKIVLVGESNVGKSCLAMRVAEDRYPEDHEHGTTHGMRFWPLEAEELHPTAKPPEGQRRDVVLWDFGGQDEYQLVHQMFLHDTTLALVLFDPTRGRAALDEARDWNKRLEKHLGQRKAVKLLVGAKVDSKAKSDLIQTGTIRAFCQEHGFADFIETSALENLGIENLRELLSKTIDWDKLAKTSRPELFQRIRDDVESRRKNGDTVVMLSDFKEAIQQAHAEIYEEAAVDAVTDQLAQQGLIVRSRRFDGTEVLVLQLPVIEQYAASLIVSARNNLQGAPAIEEERLADPNIDLPGLGANRLKDRGQERIVLECVAELLIQHGICFRHERLLVFPACFQTTEASSEDEETIGVSLYYDFSGAIDNVYASLISWLVLGKKFGNVRLWESRVEFDVAGKGTCGLRKVNQGGGFAHLDVYFRDNTDVHTKKEFISFVHLHLQKNGINVVENFELICSRCRYSFPRSVVQTRMRQLEDDVVCPQCETRNPLSQGIHEQPTRDPEVEQKTFALVTQVEERIAEDIGLMKAKVFSRPDEDFDTDDPIRVLHLSDLHFTVDLNPETKLTWLVNDVTRAEFLGFERLDYLVISGDMADKASEGGFERAREFVSRLIDRFELTPNRCILVPGNHDVQQLDEAFQIRTNPSKAELETAVKQGNIYLVPSERYRDRLQLFSEKFFHPIMQKPYPLDPVKQGMVSTFGETGLQFLMFNSCWNLDQFNPTRASINPDSLAGVTERANEELKLASRNSKKSPDDFLKIAVWHHPVHDRQRGLDNLDFVSHFEQIGVSFCLTGDVHELRRDLVRHWEAKRVEVLGAGSFAATREGLPDSSPRSYNLLEITRDHSSIRVHTRKQTRPNSAWEGWYEWKDPKGKGNLPYFDIKLG